MLRNAGRPGALSLLISPWTETIVDIEDNWQIARGGTVASTAVPSLDDDPEIPGAKPRVVTITPSETATSERFALPPRPGTQGLVTDAALVNAFVGGVVACVDLDDSPACAIPPVGVGGRSEFNQFAKALYSDTAQGYALQMFPCADRMWPETSAFFNPAGQTGATFVLTLWLNPSVATGPMIATVRLPVMPSAPDAKTGLV